MTNILETHVCAEGQCVGSQQKAVTLYSMSTISYEKMQACKRPACHSLPRWKARICTYDKKPCPVHWFYPLCIQLFTLTGRHHIVSILRT